MIKTKNAKVCENLTETSPEAHSTALLSSVESTEEELQSLYTEMTLSENPCDYSEDVNARLGSYRRTMNNLIKSYQHLAFATDELRSRYRELTGGKKRKIIPKTPPNAVIDLEENKLNHFAKGLNIYKILLLTYIGSFAGVILEIIWCFIRNGYIESRAGLVYGPFNLLYGVGAVAMTLALYRFRNRGWWLSFIGGFIVGGVVEYVCSWGCEFFFGSKSWDYSMMPFNINGRVCLLYCVYWGFLGVLWMKTIYPCMAKLILKIPSKIGKLITWALLAFFIVNSIVSAIAVFRWSQRIDLIPASNPIFEFFDNHFPDARMERIYANMKFN